jgi:hypothetical protein
MDNTETDFDEAASETKPRKTRKRNDERRVFYYQITNGKPKELGSFPETAIGTLSERNITMFAKDFFREGEIRAEIRKSNGHFERSFDFSIAETEKPNQNAIENEPEFEEVETDEAEFSFNESEQTNTLQFQLLIEKEKTKRLETELQATRAGSQNEMQTTVSALERAYEQNRELMMLMLSNAQKPQQDATTQALNMLEKSFGIVNRAKAISDEISPNETSGGSSLIADGAKLIDSLGRNAGTFLPMITGALGGNRQAVRPTAPTNGATGNGQSGELSDLLSKVKTKKELKSNEK